jgi:SAM-dependent methyltransferase
MGLDAGCGSGARDVRRLLHLGCDMTGIDAVKEVVRLTHKLWPDLRRRVFTADLRAPLPFGDEEFDFALCVSVLQHIDQGVAYGVTLPELARVLRPGGVLLLAFKLGSGTASVYDHHYHEERHFLLYDEQKMLQTLNECGMRLIRSQSYEELGGLLYCTDVKGLRYCALFARKHVNAEGEQE